jgi:hypothetical protein
LSIPANCTFLQAGLREPIRQSSRQIANFGDSIQGMPPLELVRGKDGNMRINDGVTRASRAAKLRPGQSVLAENIQDIPSLDLTRMPKVKEALP